MSSDTLMLLVAGFPDPELAQKQFDDLVSRVESKEIASRGMILVSKDADGEVSVRDTGDHMGRRGAGWGGGVGVLVGLFAPPLLASVAVGRRPVASSASSPGTKSATRSSPKSPKASRPVRLY